jgi:hypothetical protein
MSILRTVDIPCPTCRTAVSFELIISVNADRRPDMRQAILERTFQKQVCPACGHLFRVEPELTYLHIAQGLFVAVWPGSKLAQWKEYEERSRLAFDKAWGAAAPPEARAVGARLRARVVFGWPALSEKILAAQAGIDDRTLELAKIGVLRSLDAAPVAGDNEMRLLRVTDEQLVLGWVGTRSERVIEVVTAPRALIAEIEAAPQPWAALQEEVASGLFVDMQRALLAA